MSERATVLAWLRRELEKLAREEEGASLVFASITLFAVSMSIVFVYQMGLVSTDRLTVQNAADAAAYSAALRMRNRVGSRTMSGSLKARDTVAGETPARAATSIIPGAPFLERGLLAIRTPE